MDGGTTLAVVSLSFQVFGGCVKGFQLLSKARNLGKEASLLQTLLALEEYRFIQWARAVGLLVDSNEDGHHDNDNDSVDDIEKKKVETGSKTSTDVGGLPTAIRPVFNSSSLNVTVNPRLNHALAAELMVQLETLLTQDHLRKRYKLVLSNPSDHSGSIPLAVANGSEHISTVLQNLVPDTLRQRILTRAKLIQDENHLPKRLWWAAVDRKNFESMVADVRALVNGLWALLDTVQRVDSEVLMRDVLARVIQVSKHVGELRAVQERTGTKSERELVTRTGISGSNDNSSSILSIAANIKATRIEINDPDPLAALELGNNAQRLPQDMARTVDLPNLNRNLLTDVVPSYSNAHTACGVYNGTTGVWIEYKDVPRRMKGKLFSRVKNLAFLLARPKDLSFHTLQCIGFLEEEERFVFLYRYPASSPLSSPNPNPTSKSNRYAIDGDIPSQVVGQEEVDQRHPLPKSLNELMRENKTIKSPSVTARLSIARHLCNTVLTLHIAGWLHKELRSENVMFFGSNKWSEPYITGFSFSRQDSPTEISEQPSSEPQADIYRHPHALGEPSASFQRHMDLYSLGVILVELAEWKALKHIVKDCVDVRNTASRTDVPLNEIAKVPRWLIDNEIEKGQIKFRMGDVYAEIVHVCLKFGLISEYAIPDTLPDMLDMVRKLEDCRI